MRVELEEIDLSYYDIGVKKKIHTLISQNVKVYKIYANVEQEHSYRTNLTSLGAHHAGHSKTYTKKVVVGWEYSVSSLISFFKQYNTVMYKRKELVFDNQKYIKKLKELQGSNDATKSN